MNIKRKNPSLIILVLTLLLAQFFGNVAPIRAQDSQVWSAPVNISNSGAALDPVIVVSRDGVLHAIWKMSTGGFRYSKSADGATWEPSRVVEFPFVEKPPESASELKVKKEYPYRLIASADGVVNVFWIDVEGNLMLARPNSTRLSAPSAWPRAIVLGEAVLNFDVDVTSTGVFHLTYARTDEQAGIYYRRSPNGESWSAGVNLYSSQYINASTNFADAHVRVSASDDPETPIVLVAWDVRPLKRIFMVSSTDGGLDFSDARQMKGPEDTGGFGIPLNVELGVAGKNLLLIWQIGEQGAAQCTYYSQSSADGGETWADPQVILDGRSLCPEQATPLLQKEGFIMLMVKFKGGDPALMVWNGVEWGAPQVQNELSSFTNPLTFDTILLECITETLSGTTLFVAGCDQGAGSDIWLTSRSLAPLDQWAGETSLWSYPTTLALKPQIISSVAQLAEAERVHTVWAVSPISETGAGYHSIFYARLDGSVWTTPRETISGLIGKPVDLSMAVSNDGILNVVWTDSQSGALVYTTVLADRADLRAEWTEPIALPTITRLNASPDILVDASGKVLVAYAVPFNEGRGIYLIQSAGRGSAWSLPVQIFDAVTAEWDRVDKPRISLTTDGTLHVLFSRVAQNDEGAVGLYDAQSRDGGATWTAPELVREGSITWSDMLTTDGTTLHRFWQEKRAGVVSNFHQVSPDGGATWGNATDITSVLDYVSPVSLAANTIGDLHFLRIVQGAEPSFLKSKTLVVEDWQWNGNRWTKEAFQKITIKGDQLNLFLNSGLTTTGLVSALVSSAYLDLAGTQQGQVVGLARQSEVADPAAAPYAAFVTVLQAPTPPPTAAPVVPSSGDALPVEVSSPSQYRNVAGFILVALIVVLSLYFFRRRGGGKS